MHLALPLYCCPFGAFLGFGALGAHLGGGAQVGQVSPDIVTKPKLHRPGPQREPAENLDRSVQGSAGGIILVEQVAREEDEITARRWSALASGSPQRLQSIVAPDWVFVIIAKVVVGGEEDSDIIIGHREGRGMKGWGRRSG